MKKTKKTEKEKQKEESKVSVILPRITEKGTDLSSRGVYTFDVNSNLNKQEVAKAVFALYKVKPVKVNILKVPIKKIFYRGRTNYRKGGVKAVVYLKKGDKIEFV